MTLGMDWARWAEHGMGGLGPGKEHDTNRLGTNEHDTSGLGTGWAQAKHEHGRTGHELSTNGLGTIELCPNVTGTR